MLMFSFRILSQCAEFRPGAEKAIKSRRSCFFFAHPQCQLTVPVRNYVAVRSQSALRQLWLSGMSQAGYHTRPMVYVMHRRYLAMCGALCIICPWVCTSSLCMCCMIPGTAVWACTWRKLCMLVCVRVRCIRLRSARLLLRFEEIDETDTLTVTHGWMTSASFHVHSLPVHSVVDAD